jgi:soluble epoxide hydrolase/lipid-phosphate phosphatase
MENITRDLLALLDVFFLDNAIFLGHDWGGTVVLNMAIQYPAKVKAVGSICTPFFPCNPNKNPWHAMKTNPGRFDY